MLLIVRVFLSSESTDKTAAVGGPQSKTSLRVCAKSPVDDVLLLIFSFGEVAYRPSLC